MQGQPKRHHYIPQFFLKNFSTNNKDLWVFDRVKKEYRNQSITQIASENKFYNYISKGKEQNLEAIFSQIEGLAKPILDKIINKQEISMQEKADFSMFLGTLRVRIPDFKKWTEESGEKMHKKMHKITFSNRSYVENLAKKAGKKLTRKEIDDIMSFATDEKRYSLKFPPNYWIKIMLQMSLDVADLFIDSHWQIYYFDKKYALVTSDNPVVLVPPKDYHPFYDYGLATPGTRKVITLTSNICLVTGELSKNPLIIRKESDNKDLYRWFNKITAANSDRFVYSPEKGKLEKIVKDTKIDSYIREQRVSVS